MSKPIAAIAVLVLLAGCAAKVKEELHSSGTEDSTLEGAQADGAAKPNDLPSSPSIEKQPGDAPLIDLTKDPAKDPKADALPSNPTPDVTMKSLAGTYDGKLDIPQESLDALLAMVPADQKASAQAAISDIKNVKVVLELKSDGNYDIATTARGKTEHENGKWTYDAGKGQITVKSPEIPADRREQMLKSGLTEAQIEAMQKKEETCAVTEGGKVLVLKNTQGGMSVTVTFTKR